MLRRKKPFAMPALSRLLSLLLALLPVALSEQREKPSSPTMPTMPDFTDFLMWYFEKGMNKTKVCLFFDHLQLNVWL